MHELLVRKLPTEQATHSNADEFEFKEQLVHKENFCEQEIHKFAVVSR